MVAVVDVVQSSGKSSVMSTIQKGRASLFCKRTSEECHSDMVYFHTPERRRFKSYR